MNKYRAESIIFEINHGYISYGNLHNNDDEGLNLIRQALELQIPKRIIDGNFCPRCNAGFGIHWPEWCGNCGQKIDYNMEKEK